MLQIQQQEVLEKVEIYFNEMFTNMLYELMKQIKMKKKHLLEDFSPGFNVEKVHISFQDNKTVSMSYKI